MIWVRSVKGRRFCVAVGIAAGAWLASSPRIALASPQITFTTNPPTRAVEGGSYTVSATEPSGGQVYITLTGACSFRTSAEVKKEPTPKAPALPRLAPIVAHFVEAGTCVIEARGAVGYGEEEPRGSQSFVIERAPATVEAPGRHEAAKRGRRSQAIAFISRAPAAATVGGRIYRVVAKASSGLRVAVVSQTPRVCRLVGDAVRFVDKGRCMLEAIQRGNTDYLAAQPAHQSFMVRRR
jgi:large repetitive protein